MLSRVIFANCFLPLKVVLYATKNRVSYECNNLYDERAVLGVVVLAMGVLPWIFFDIKLEMIYRQHQVIYVK